MNNPFQKANVILHKLNEHGFDAYIVGGSVRDFLQGAPIHDIDIATSATPNQVMAIFPKTFPVGIEHGTILVRHEDENYEVTTFRSEAGYKDFRHPDNVAFVDSIEQDLSRRDFTMNAMAMDIHGVIIDPYAGQKDLEHHCLKTVGESVVRFKEDPLRMLRAVRFVAQLNLSADHELQKALTNVAPYLKHLAIERIRDEFTKLLAGKWFGRGIELLTKTGLNDYLPFFALGIEHIDRVSAIPFSSLTSNAERWALFLVVSGYDAPERVLRAWRFSNKDQNKISKLIKTFNDQKGKNWDKLSLYMSGLNVANSVERMKLAAGLNIGDFKEIHNLWDELSIKSRSELVINGADLSVWLGKTGGPWTGQLLEKIEESVVMGNLINDREVIREWVQRVN